MTADERAEAPEHDLGNEDVTVHQGEQPREDDIEQAVEEEIVIDGELVDDNFDVPSELMVVSKERDEYLDALRRLQAEFDNYRKRVGRQQTEQLERANEVLLERLLPVLDALDLAVAHGAAAAEADDSDARQALAQIAALLAQILTKEGLERIAEPGVDFDPTIHDAVAHEAATSDPEESDLDGSAHHHIVDTVMRAGYRLKGRVLRPAMVKVRG